MLKSIIGAEVLREEEEAQWWLGSGRGVAFLTVSFVLQLLVEVLMERAFLGAADETRRRS